MFVGTDGRIGQSVKFVTPMIPEPPSNLLFGHGFEASN